jgi:hypothetical protein
MNSLLDETAIIKNLRLDALQHPMTILPAALCILSIIYWVLLEDIVGGAGYILIIILSSAVVATGSFLWLYFIHYEDAYAKRINEIAYLQDQIQTEKNDADIKHLIAAVRTGFKKTNTTDGLNALTDLVQEYQKILQVVEYKKEIDPLALVHIPALVEETFLQGLSVLSDVLELSKIIHKPDIDNLEKKLKATENEIKSLRQHKAKSSLLRIKIASADSYKERLDMINQQALRHDTLLYQYTSCEASLHKTRVELTALKTENSERSIGAVSETLRQTIKQAQEIQEEFKRLSH